MSAGTGKGQRHTIRLRGYDYTKPGAYFVTICTQDKAELFGAIKNGEMVLNQAGKMVQEVWEEIPDYYPGIDIDAFVVMPDHVHGIIIICDTTVIAATGLSLSDVVHRFKSMTTTRYICGVKKHGWQQFNGRLWQRNYWERIIRNEHALNRIREYIRKNPSKWKPRKC